VRIDVITIFPEYFSGILEASLIGKGIAAGKLEIRLHQLRDWTEDKHRTVDDTPYGGGHGMVMKIEPLVRALEAVALPGAVRLLLAARGAPFTQQRAHELAEVEQLVLICGRYEGVDERLAAFIDGQLGIGDYVLNGGGRLAAVVIDAVTRLVPGIIGNPGSLESESFAEGLLEYPQYTRPETFRGDAVPPVLLSGNHAEIERWRRDQALQDTRLRRPDLLRTLPNDSGVTGSSGDES
jgi:tRNA (guanine37-N1)-methyltransferase